MEIYILDTYLIHVCFKMLSLDMEQLSYISISYPFLLKNKPSTPTTLVLLWMQLARYTCYKIVM